MRIWTQDSFARVLPESPPQNNRRLEVRAARGEVADLQIGLRPSRLVGKLRVQVSGPLAPYTTVRLAELVPLRHHTPDGPAELLEGHAPGLVPDPLLPLADQPLSPGVSRALWVTVRIPTAARRSTLRFTLCDETRKLGTAEALVNPWPFTLPRLTLPVTNWFYSDALCDWYRMDPFSPPYWDLLARYFRNLVDHHQTAIYTPLFTPPLDKEKRDLQLIDVREVRPGIFQFGWERLRQWIRLAQRCGFQYFEMSHLFSQWGCRHAIRILVRRPSGKIATLCPPQTPATHPTYRRFLSQFLPQLLAELRALRVLPRCIFHLSDEPKMHLLAEYRAAREMVRDIAPQMRITEASSHDTFTRLGLIDQPVPQIEHLDRFLNLDRRPWVYYSCQPRGRYPNRFLDYPLYRHRVLGMMLHRFHVTGFLHWGCNYWYRYPTRQPIDPYQVTDNHGWPALTGGDCFIVYPGPDGPVDSIRWETFRAMFDDWRLLAAVAARHGPGRVQRLLRGLKSAADYPQHPAYLRRIRQQAAQLLYKTPRKTSP